MTTRSWLEISISKLLHNLNAIRSRLGNQTLLMPVLKANAYGHGLTKIGRILSNQGVSCFAVAWLEDAIKLRKILPKKEILVLNGFQNNEVQTFIEHQFTAVLHHSKPVPSGLRVEVKIDTGMTRLGIPWEQASRFSELKTLKISGVFSHFARADLDPNFSHLQLQRLLKVTAGLGKRQHICNSAGLRFPKAHLDLVRIGLAIYGIAPCAGFDDLQPVLRWKSRLLSVKNIKVGKWIGYGSTFKTKRESRIAIVPVGYADGYPRILSNQSSMLVRGKLAPVVGRVNMDLTCIDVTSIEDVYPGTEVEILSDKPKSPLSCRALANLTDTIPYEIFSGIKAQVERRYLD